MALKTDISVFMDPTFIPVTQDVRQALGKTYPLWESIRKYVVAAYPAVIEEWKYPGKNYGWNLRLKDKKRIIVYLLPREEYFKVALVFGPSATGEVMKSQVSASIKTALAEAKAYAEGRGIRLDVKHEDDLADIRQLIAIKLKH